MRYMFSVGIVRINGYSQLRGDLVNTHRKAEDVLVSHCVEKVPDHVPLVQRQGDLLGPVGREVVNDCVKFHNVVHRQLPR